MNILIGGPVMFLVNISYVPYKKSGMRNEKIFFEMIESQKIFSGGMFIDPIVTATGFYGRVKSFINYVKFPIFPVASSACLISPKFFLPLTFRFPQIARLQAKLVAKKILKHIPENMEYVLWINNPNYTNYFLAKELMGKAEMVVFDMADDYLSFSGGADENSQKRLFDLLEKSDLMLAVNEHVKEKYQHSNSIVFNNCTDFNNFRRPKKPYFFESLFPKNINEKYAGYIGGVNRGKIDLVLLEKLFAEFPEIKFIFVGTCSDEKILEFIHGNENSFFIPFVEYNSLPDVVKDFDVCLVPNLINEHTSGNDLLKVVDYMAAGVPVVSTACAGVERYSDCVHIADEHDSFISLVKGVLEGGIESNVERGLEYAKANSWDVKVPRLESWLLSNFESR